MGQYKVITNKNMDANLSIQLLSPICDEEMPMLALVGASIRDAAKIDGFAIEILADSSAAKVTAWQGVCPDVFLGSETISVEYAREKLLRFHSKPSFATTISALHYDRYSRSKSDKNADSKPANFENVDIERIMNALISVNPIIDFKKYKFEKPKSAEKPLMVVVTDMSSSANTAFAILFSQPGEDIRWYVENANAWLIKPAENNEKPKLLRAIAISQDIPKEARRIDITTAYFMLKDGHKDPFMSALADTAFSVWAAINGIKVSISGEATKKTIKEELRDTNPEPIKKEKLKSLLSSFEELDKEFAKGQLIIAAESNSGKWVPTNYYGRDQKRFYVTNGIKVFAIARYSPELIGKKWNENFSNERWTLDGGFPTLWKPL